jgi:acetyl-CoA carboxylase biotin carboxyl carrier protein
METKKPFDVPNLEEIIELVRVVEGSDMNELSIEVDGFRLVIGKGVCNANRFLSPASPVVQNSTVTDRTPIASSPPNRTTELTPAPASREAVASTSSVTAQEGLLEIKAPLLGIFYRAPKPGAAPFVEIGSRVNPEDTLCIIEVMKLFNTVKSGFSGRIVRICAENNQMVEYNQTLFLLEPDEVVPQ